MIVLSVRIGLEGLFSAMPSPRCFKCLSIVLGAVGRRQVVQSDLDLL